MARRDSLRCLYRAFPHVATERLDDFVLTLMAQPVKPPRSSPRIMCEVGIANRMNYYGGDPCSGALPIPGESRLFFALRDDPCWRYLPKSRTWRLQKIQAGGLRIAFGSDSPWRSWRDRIRIDRRRDGSDRVFYRVAMAFGQRCPVCRCVHRDPEHWKAASEDRFSIAEQADRALRGFESETIMVEHGRFGGSGLRYFPAICSRCLPAAERALRSIGWVDPFSHPSELSKAMFLVEIARVVAVGKADGFLPG